jgi:hypothetical protein
VALRVSRYGDAVPAKAGDGERHLFSGSMADITADMRALRDIGVSSVDFGFPGTTVDATLKTMQQFKSEVLAKL